MSVKHNYEEPEIEVISLYSSDIITASPSPVPYSPFNGEDDRTDNWSW